MVSRINGLANIMVIILNNLNYVFGGFASVAPTTGTYTTDSNAYLFLLRSKGNATSQKFSISDYSSADYYSLHFESLNFGYQDIYLYQNSDTGSYTDFCSAYQCPPGMSYGDYSQVYLSGVYSGWKTPEIEVNLMS